MKTGDKKLKPKKLAQAPCVYSVPADTALWSEQSKRSVSFEFVKAYTDHAYDCRHCGRPAVFTAQEQKQTYEVDKANINQQRVFCPTCWSGLCQASDELDTYVAKWAESKNILRQDQGFLSDWLRAQLAYDAYKPHYANVAITSMLKKLLQQ